jgi:hypothetical protein
MRNVIVALALLPFSLDPRIKRIKQQEKEAREAKKRGIAPAGPVKKTKQEEEEEKNKAELEAKQKEEEEKVCIQHISVSRFDSQINSLSLLVLRLRNKRLRLLTLQRRLEGSNAWQKRELRWFWIPVTRTGTLILVVVGTRDVDVVARVLLHCTR